MDRDDACLADFVFRKSYRLRYPGACSLEYQSVVQIVIESLFQWDIKAQKAKGPGVLGTLLAYAPADEEQGRKTLHMHMQIWVKEVDQKLRDDLFHENQELQQIARKSSTLILIKL